LLLSFASVAAAQAKSEHCGGQESPVVLDEGDYAPCSGLLFTNGHAAEIFTELEGCESRMKLELDFAASKCNFSLLELEARCGRDLAMCKVEQPTIKDYLIIAGGGALVGSLITVLIIFCLKLYEE